MSDMDVTAMFRALGDPTRRSIFEFLSERCCALAEDIEEPGSEVQGATVGEVCCHVTGCEKFSSTVSFHIKELRLSGLINAHKSGKYMVCSVRPQAIQAMAAYLESLPKPGRSCDPSSTKGNPTHMKTLQIYDPAMCCSTGVCGPSVDQTLVKLAADVAFLQKLGVKVERFNLAQQPGAFTANPLVLSEMGEKAEHLPLFLVDGKLSAKATYPTRADFLSWLGLDPSTSGLQMASGGCCDSAESSDGCCQSAETSAETSAGLSPESSAACCESAESSAGCCDPAE